MSCETYTELIDGHEFNVTQWPVEKAITMKFKLIETFGAGVVAVISEQNNGEIDISKLSGAMSSVFAASSPEKITALLKECVILNVSTNGTKITEIAFNELFSGNDMGTFYKVVVFVIKANFGNLLQGQLGGSLLARMG